jgi:alkanesulfonate monooxygenase SsuD/methylene tetrahydromethanopterin reductase-like flavin-dependent oxidoreductase (luciferase family)
VVRGYGWEAQAREIQDLYLDGRKDAAAAAVPEEMLRQMALVGPRGHVAERLAAFAAAGVTTVNVTPFGGSAAERVAQVEATVELAADA